ncbi:peptide-methionine (R)-S-oxide reductase [Pontivivens ytuae]|uniref:peptide-methionine (R)-S-oxide reductase n=1 Tax=Pontivivens ytuae TaxID=2789856 RepID=A0A7S9LPL0_9RHOB|nr:peptide-methionine (R)-S-oxide reductase [Pontivivens ytuae]QPH52630.1 peptide-methionine (R)-S-oxide reductase [Pontivivens ytuae]
MDYEVVRSEAEWREQLTEDEYAILREGGTERPHSHPLSQDYRAGEFLCKGCGLCVYVSRWREQVDKGWVFFRHAQPDTVLMAIDGPEEAYGQAGMGLESLTNIEAHCRRCSSHLGHILIVERKLLHCINGTALTFEPAEA